MKRFYTLLGILLLCVFVISVHAQEFSSAQYSITGPIISPGSYGTSSSFGLSGVVSQIANGSSSASTYDLLSGFLYFPFITTPIISATAGNAQVSLSWTPAVTGLGFTTSGYVLGLSTVSGGPYSYTDVGNVVSSTATGLANAIPYYFVIRVKDAFGNFIATSTQVSSTPIAPIISGGGSGGGGGSSGGGSGGGGGAPVTNNSSTGAITFSGRAYPQSSVTVLRDAQVVATTIASADATFKVSLNNITTGNYIFSVYSEDAYGIRSSLLTFPATITSGGTNIIEGIFVTPTIAVDKSEVRRGDTIGILGQTTPQADVVISVHSEPEYFAKTVADKNGAYFYNFDTSFLELGSHTTKSKSAIKDQLVSGFSSSVNFIVGTKNVPVVLNKAKKTKRGDQNGDGKVNIIDYSILAYWYKKPNPPVLADLNSDGKVTIFDLSILAANWTG